MDPYRPPPPVPTAPHIKLPPDTAGETASGSHTAGEGASSVFSAASREPRAGDIIGPYRVIRELGRGGMAVVYEAQDTELPRHVALKVLLTAGADPQSKLRFVREAHAQAKISHEHVVTIFRVGEAAGVSYIAMPVLNGQTLAASLAATPRPQVDSVVRIAGEIAEGLAAAHAVGLVHRDIKPGNVWLEAPKWRVKILDFGLARDPHANAGADITIDGHVVGTPAYMSPEQAAGHAVDHRTDLWSLGVVLYQMTTGQKPFTGENALSLMTAILTVEPAAPVALAPDLPPTLSGLIQRLLSKDPNRRPASATAVVAELDAIARALTAPKVVVVSLPPPVPTPAVPNPWSDIEATETAVPAPRTVRERHKPEEEVNREPFRHAPRSRKGLWVGGSALAAALLGGLVWLAVAAVSPKTKPTEQTEKPPPAPPPAQPPKPAPDHERLAAETLLPYAKLTLRFDGPSRDVDVGPGGALPPGKFTVQMIDFEDNLGLNLTFVTKTFLPAVANLKALIGVRMKSWQMRLSVEHVRQLAAAPLKDTLVRLDAQMELTPALIVELKKFRALIDVTFFVPQPHDELFVQLAQLPQFELVAFLDLPSDPRLTDKGWEAIARLPLKWFTMVESKGAPVALRALSAPGKVARAAPPALEFLGCTELGDADLLELSERPTDVRILSVRAVNFTDAGVKHLAAVKSLKGLVLNQTKVTEEGLKALSAARPDMKITWDGKEFGPKKKP